MDIYNIIIIVLALTIAYFCWKKYDCGIKNTKPNQIENLANVSQESIKSVTSLESENPTNKTKTITHPIDLLEDNAFSDVIFFRSDQIFGETTGLQRCMDNCSGTCIEFGPTTNAMCFPRQ